MPEYIDFFRPLRRPPRHLGELLPWDVLLLKHPLSVIATKDDGLLCGFTMAPFDLGSATLEEQGALVLRVNEALKRLDDDWAGWINSSRRGARIMEPQDWPHPVAAELDAEHRARMAAQGLWEDDIALYLWRRMPTETISWLKRVFSDETPPDADDEDPPRNEAYDLLEEFIADVERWTGFLQGCAVLEPMDSDTLLTALHAPICLHPHPVRTPEYGIDLSRVMVDVGLFPKEPKNRVKLGTAHEQRYVRCLTLSSDIPPELGPVVFHQLYTLPFPFTYSWRWIAQDRGLARQNLNKRQRDINTTRKGWRDIYLEMRLGHEVATRNSHLDRMETEVDAARDLMLSDEFVMGDLTIVFVLMHEDWQEVSRRVRLVERLLQAAGCVIINEGRNTTEAFLGTLPGCPYANVRTLRMTSHNGASFGAWHRPSAGPTRTAHLHGPVLTQGVTNGCMPFGMSTYVGDVGDSGTVGPKGVGKSTKDAFLDYVSFLRFEEAQVIGFDVGGSMRCVTRCLGGTYHDLGRGDVGIQVLRDLDVPGELPWIHGWMMHRLAEKGLGTEHSEDTADAESFVSTALRGLHERSQMPRRMTSLMTLMAEHIRDIELHSNSQIDANGQSRRDSRLDQLVKVGRRVRLVLREFAEGGLYGHLTDAPRDDLSLGRVHTFELGQLLKTVELYPAELEIVFHRMEQRIDGRPTRLYFGEAWHYFSNATFLKWLEVSMTRWRRENASANFSTQSISQLVGNKLTALLMESVQTWFFMPNAKALTRQVCDAYLGMNLHEEEIQSKIVMARPKRDVYFCQESDGVQPWHRRLVDLQLDPMAQAICGANSQEAHALMDRIDREYPPELFPVGYLEAVGYHEAARRVQQALDRDAVPDAAMALTE